MEWVPVIMNNVSDIHVKQRFSHKVIPRLVPSLTILNPSKHAVFSAFYPGNSLCPEQPGNIFVPHPGVRSTTFLITEYFSDFVVIRKVAEGILRFCIQKSNSRLSAGKFIIDGLNRFQTKAGMPAGGICLLLKRRFHEKKKKIGQAILLRFEKRLMVMKPQVAL